MLKYLFSNRLFIGALAFFVLMVVGGTLYMRHVKQQSARELAETNERIKALTKNPPATVQVPVGDTSQGGHSHGDEEHADPHKPPQTAQLPVLESGKEGPIKLPIPSGIVPDWAAMSPDELAAAIEAIEKRHVAAPNGYYYKRESDGSLLRDESGYPTLHKIGEPAFKVVKDIGFAPTREEYAYYQSVQQELVEAQAIGNSSEIERLQGELQHMYNTYRGEIPTISYSIQTTDPNADIEALHKYAASRATRLRYEAYRKSGFEYLIPTESQ